MDLHADRLARPPEGRSDHPGGDQLDRRTGDARSRVDTRGALGAFWSLRPAGRLQASRPQWPSVRLADVARGDVYLPRQGAPVVQAAAPDLVPLRHEGP